MNPPDHASRPPAQQSRRRVLRRWLALLVALSLTLMALGAALAWLGSAQGLAWLLQRPWIEARSGVQVRGVSGSLWSELRVRNLDWSDGTTRVRAEQVLLRWRAAALLRAQPVLQVDRLDVRRLEFASASTPSPPSPGGPPRLPTSLQPPLPVRIDHLGIGSLRMQDAQPGQARELGSLHARVWGDARQWRLSADGRGPWGSLQGRAGMAARAPFDLHGELAGELLAQAHALRVQARLGGSLARMSVLVRARALQAQAQADAELRPFDAVWLGPTRIRIDGLDPRRLQAAWPEAMLEVRAELHEAPGGALLGSLQLRNQQPGSIDAQRVPLRELRARLQLRDGILRADTLRAELSGGARADGLLQWSLRASASARLQVRGLDLHALYGRLVPTRLDGSVDLQGDSASQRLALALTQPGWVVSVQARRDGSRIDVPQAELRAHGASLVLSGSLDSAASRAFRVDARLHDFQPQRFGDWPQAQLNLRLLADGRLAPREAAFQLQVQPSRWRSRVFVGHASGRVSPGVVRGLRADLRVGDNTLRAHGDFGRAADRLQLNLQALALDQLGMGWGGSLQASGTLQGGLAEPGGVLQVKARGLRGPHDVRLARLDADASLLHGPRGRVALHVQAHEIQLPGIALRELGLRANGTLPAHHLQLSVRDAQRLRLRATATGSWQSGHGWTGRIETLDNAGPYALHLLHPATVEVGTNGNLLLRGALMRSHGGTVDLRSVRRDAAVWSSEGTARDFDPAYWARLAGLDLHGLRSDLRLQASWQLRGGQDPQARLLIERGAGDVRLPGEPGLSLGLSRLRLQISAVQGRIQAALDAAGSHVGSVHAEASVPFAHGAAGWGVSGDAPLQASAHLQLPDLSWVSALLPQAARVSGSLRGDLQVGGVVAAPRLSGRLEGSALAVALPALGLQLRDGSLAADFAGDRVELRSLRLRDPTGGSVNASGQVRLSGGKALGNVHVELDKLQALDRPGQQVRLSGRADLQSSAAGLGIDADLRVDKAGIELAGGNAPRLADDVVVEGRPARKPGLTSAPVHALVRVDLGQDFRVSGQGVDARLGGKLLLRSDPGQPLRAEGSIVVRSGSYSAYGQSLQLVSGGSVNFSGPVDNPGLNLAAQREGLPVQVGVRIAGTLRAPLVSLTSTPPMPDSAILSWLVLGQDPSTVGADQSSLLQVAGAALLSRGAGGSPTGKLADALGLDEVKIGGGDGGLQSSVVTLGKKLSSRLSVSVERGLSAAGSLFNVRYAFTERLSLRLQSGADNAVDVFYTFRFD